MRYGFGNLKKETKPKSQEKKFRSYTEAYWHYSKDSKCSVRFHSYKNPDYLHIQFSGPVANIPALKNEKMQGKGFLRPEAKARLAIMSDLFQRACNHKIPQFDPKLPVFCLILCAYRKNAFDEDNVATSIRDWLEPKYIRNKNRGWGVGVVPNDRMVKVYAVKKTKESKDFETTEIFIRPYSAVKESEENFLRKILT